MTGRRVILAVLATAALALLTAGPGAAAPTVTALEPADGARLRSPGTAIRGVAEENELGRIIRGVVVKVSGPSGPHECGNCWTPDVNALPGTKANFSWQPPLDHNGPHTVTVSVTSALAGLENVDQKTQPVERTLKVEVPPAPPQGVRADLGPDRKVTISWARNTEPDLKSYRVSRVAPGSAGGTVVTSVPQPPPGPRVSAVDAALPPIGGRYHYVVTAIRPDGDGNLSDQAIARSTPASLDVAAGPTPGVGLPGPGVAAPGGRGGGGVSSILTPGGGVPTSLALPEGAALPLDDGSSSADAFSLPGGEGSESAESALDESRSASNQRALFIPLAAGLLLCVLAFHLRQFSRTVLDAPAAYHPLLEPESGGGRRDREPPTAVLVGANRPGRADPQSPE